MTGIKDDFNLKGKDLTPNILNNKPINHTLFFEDILYGAEKKAVLKNGWKLIENTGIKFKKSLDPLGDLMEHRHPEYKKGFELYNINHDFQEKHNMINEYPQIGSKLRGYLRSFIIGSSNYQKFKRSNLKKSWITSNLWAILNKKICSFTIVFPPKLKKTGLQKKLYRYCRTVSLFKKTIA